MSTFNPAAFIANLKTANAKTPQTLQDFLDELASNTYSTSGAANTLGLTAEQATDLTSYLTSPAYTNFYGPAIQSPSPTAANIGAEQIMYDDGAIAPLSSAAAATTSSTTTTTNSTGVAPAAVTIGAAGGLQFHLTFDASVGSAPTGFVAAVEQAALTYTQDFSNKEVINIDVGYGEVAGQAISAGNLAQSASLGYYETYGAVTTALNKDASASTYQATADASLATTTAESGDKFFVTSADAKTLGMLSATSTALNGYIGLSSAYNFSYNQSSIASNQFDAVGTFEHELSEVMGRVSADGYTSGAGVYTPLDLFRYTASGALETNAGSGFLSINGGQTTLGQLGAPGAGDLGDWASSVVGDSYGDGYIGKKAALSSTDLVEDSLLGYDPTALTTAATKTLSLA